MFKKTLSDLHKKMALIFQTTKYSTDEPCLENLSAFRDECAHRNLAPARVILWLALGMESLMVIFYLLQNIYVKQASFFPQYIYLYVSMILLSCGFLILLHIFKNSPSESMRLQLVILTVFGVWSSIFSAFDVINGFSSYLFIQWMVIHSLAFRVNPIKHCAINIISFSVYMAMVLYSHLDITTTFAELINPFFMLIAACAMIFFNDHKRYTAYLDHNLIEEQNKKLAYYANYDFLTKIPNRKSIIEYLDELLINKNTISCMMIDIDDFKLYNDTYGHIMGDHCLINLASVIEKHVTNQGGKVGRYGGEEFLVIFSNKEKDCILQIANELVRLVRKQEIEFSTNKSCGIITISIGVYMGQSSESFDALITFADNALYKVKKSGKNNVTLYQD